MERVKGLTVAKRYWGGGKSGNSSRDYEVSELVLYYNKQIRIHLLNAMECSKKQWLLMSTVNLINMMVSSHQLWEINHSHP